MREARRVQVAHTVSHTDVCRERSVCLRYRLSEEKSFCKNVKAVHTNAVIIIQQDGIRLTALNLQAAEEPSGASLNQAQSAQTLHATVNGEKNVLENKDPS